MEIPDIKERLGILKVLAHYSQVPDKNNLLNCPFHEDKTASLQVYPKTETYHCLVVAKQAM
jgi:DNA primase